MTWPPPGRRLLPREAAQLLYDAGWAEPRNLTIMVAVCQQEAQFYCEAVGPTNPDGTEDFGWPQINSAHHGKFGYQTVDAFKTACFDPKLAAGFARVLYREAGGFRPWVAYTSGAYRKFLGNAVIGVANMLAASFKLDPIPYAKGP